MISDRLSKLAKNDAHPAAQGAKEWALQRLAFAPELAGTGRGVAAPELRVRLAPFPPYPR